MSTLEGLEGTIGHLIQGNGRAQIILLGKKTTGNHHIGLYIGAGGKMEPEDSSSPLACVAREHREELGIVIDQNSTVHFATVDYYHPRNGGHELKFRVHYFNIFRWTGIPRPLEGFSEVGWFPTDGLPYGEMPADLAHWLPKAFEEQRGQKRFIRVEVYYEDVNLTRVENMSIGFEPAIEVVGAQTT